MVSRGSSARRHVDRTRYELAHSAGHRSPGYQVDASSVSIHRLPSNRSLADGCRLRGQRFPSVSVCAIGYIAQAIIAWCAYIRTRQRSICPKGGACELRRIRPNCARSWCDHKVGSWSHREGDRPDPATDQGLASLRGARPGEIRLRGAGGVQPFRRDFAMDVPVLATDYYERYGYNRPIVTLGFDLLFVGPTADFFGAPAHPASRRNADEALRSGGLVVVFPGGNYALPTLVRPKQDSFRWP